jgi:acyl carrier protein
MIPAEPICMETQALQIREQIRSILVNVLALDVEPARLGDDTVLFDGQLGVDSVAAIDILLHIEETFEIRIADEQIDAQLFQSVNSLAGAVEDCLRAEHHRQISGY